MTGSERRAVAFAPNDFAVLTSTAVIVSLGVGSRAEITEREVVTTSPLIVRNAPEPRTAVRSHRLPSRILLRSSRYAGCACHANGSTIATEPSGSAIVSARIMKAAPMSPAARPKYVSRCSRSPSAIFCRVR